MDPFRAARILALRAVLKPDLSYQLRQVRRWYSREFHTPLSEVEHLPDEELLQAFYETKFQDLEPEDLEKERQYLLETPEERKERRRQEDLKKAEDEEFRQMVAEEERAKHEKTKPSLQTTKAPEKLLGKAPSDSDKIDTADIPEVLPPEISMSFVSDHEFAELDTLGKMDEE